MSKKIAYFEATGEILLDFMRRISNIPENAVLVRCEMVPPRSSPLNEPSNAIRFIIESSDFGEVLEGNLIPNFEVISQVLVISNRSVAEGEKHGLRQ